MLTQYETERLYLRIIAPTSQNAISVLNFYLDNKELFERFEPERPEKFYTKNYQKNCLTFEYNSMLSKSNIRFWIYKKENPDKIIGTISFSNIQRGVISCCTVGYKMDEAHQHQGYCYEALTKAIAMVSSSLHIHRIVAYILSDNIPSKNLIQKVGFEYEGIARQCIMIGSSYEDHEQYSFINHDL